MSWSVRYTQAGSGAWSKQFETAAHADGRALTPDELRIVKAFLHVN
ncbi:hypothetical protein ACFXQA_14510 [Microbacterium sp. P07]